MRSLFAYLSPQPDVEAVIWFGQLKETDGQLDSSPSPSPAVREALPARRTAARPGP